MVARDAGTRSAQAVGTASAAARGRGLSVLPGAQRGRDRHPARDHARVGEAPYSSRRRSARRFDGGRMYYDGTLHHDPPAHLRRHRVSVFTSNRPAKISTRVSRRRRQPHAGPPHRRCCRRRTGGGSHRRREWWPQTGHRPAPPADNSQTLTLPRTAPTSSTSRPTRPRSGMAWFRSSSCRRAPTCPSRSTPRTAPSSPSPSTRTSVATEAARRTPSSWSRTPMIERVRICQPRPASFSRRIPTVGSCCYQGNGAGEEVR